MAAYAALVLWIGWRTGRGHQTTDELFLGGRRIPAWAAFLSMVATELSAATYIAVPAAAYGGDWAYLQFAFGALAGKVVLGVWFIRRYHAMGLVTVYGFLQQRFGRGVELLASWFFLVGRLFASGSRLFIGALAFATVTGQPMVPSILMAGLVAGIYTLSGGIKAVIWTDTLQGAVFIFAAVTALVVVLGETGGLGEVWTTAESADKTQVFHFPDLGGPTAAEIWDALLGNYITRASAFLVALFGGFFLTLASHGTDQDMVQRLLTTRTGNKGAMALIGSAITNFPLSALFLFLGTSLWVFYRPDSPDPWTAYDISDSGRIFPVFVLHEIPAGIRGLIFAGLFAAAMSSMDSALNSLATTWVVNIRRNAQVSPEERLRMTRRATVVLGLLLIGAALGCVAWAQAMKASGFGLLDVALGSMTILYGGLLGAFLVGMMTERGSQGSVMAGMLASGCLGLVLLFQPLYTDGAKVVVAWPWWIIIGTVVSFGIGVLGRSKPRPPGKRSPLWFFLYCGLVVLLLMEVGVRVLSKEAHGHLQVGDLKLVPFARVSDEHRQILNTKLDQFTYKIPDRELGWTIRPNGRSRDGMGAANAMGLRSAPSPVRPPSDSVSRVLLLGDSYTHGDEVPWNATWAAQLQRTMGDSYEILNGGVGGYGTDQAILRGRRLREKLRPQWIVLGIHTDDMLRNVTVMRAIQHPWTNLPWPKPRFILDADQESGLRLVNHPVEPWPPEKVIDVLANYDDHPGLRDWDRLRWPDLYTDRAWYGSRLLRWVASRKIHRDRHEDRQALMRDENEAVMVTALLARMFCREVTESGARPLVLLLPADDEIPGYAEGKNPRLRYLHAQLERLEVPFVDAGSALFKELKPGESPAALYLMSHMNRRGNGVVARTLAPLLR